MYSLLASLEGASYKTALAGAIDRKSNAHAEQEKTRLKVNIKTFAKSGIRRYLKKLIWFNACIFSLLLFLLHEQSFEINWVQ